jgi:diguanylate cyclase (GGDEF)-like protein/PAS domain S-box-containing protein
MKWRTTAFSGIAIAVSAALLELTILAGLAFYRLSYADQSHAVVLLALAASGAVSLVFFALGMVLLNKASDRRHRVERDLLDTFLEYIPDNVFFKDRESRFVRIGRAMADYCGLANPEEAVDKTDSDIFSSEHALQALADEREIMRTGQPMIGKEEKETWPDGHETWVLTTKVPLKDRLGEIIGTMGIAHDITGRKQAETQVRYMALHDSLTGLPNRTLLEDRLSQAMALASRNEKSAAVLILDLNRFKSVNDTFGRYVGDRLLEEVAVRLKACLRESDTVGRVGSDEFVIVLPLAANDAEMERVAQKVLETLADPFEIEGHELHVGGSIGISRYPEDGERPDSLLELADAAMYEAKRKGRGAYCFFSRALTRATQRQLQLENDLSHACERDEFVLFYQPIISTDSEHITGVEALLRWRHPEYGLISPNQFIPQLEELGLMVGVGRWVLRAACRQNVAWQRMGFPPIRMAVNVSSQQFYQGNIVETVAGTLHETGLDAKLLELELTESRTLDDSPATIAIMQDLKRLGVSLSLDDFGTGWSSLSYLRRFPIDRLKIDRSFVRDLASEATAEAVVKSILGLGRNLGITCIAEGVETRQQRDFLKKQMCTEMQGFLFAQPMMATDLNALLRAWKYGSKEDMAHAGTQGAGAEPFTNLPASRSAD